MFRDPCVVREPGGWRMLVGAGYVDGRAGVVSFTSPDLVDWSYTGCFLDRSVASTDPVWAGSGWECPQLLSVEGRDVLVLSAWHDGVTRHVVAAIGTRVRDRFVVGHWTRIGYGPGPTPRPPSRTPTGSRAWCSGSGTSPTRLRVGRGH